jgi:4-carboxymuconolactone decarboxylase
MHHRETVWRTRAAAAAVAAAALVTLATVSRASAGPGQPARFVVPDRPGATRPHSLTTPRIPPLPETQWTGVHRALLAKYQPERPPGNALKTLLRVPELADGTMPFERYITRDSSLSARHREILILRTSWLVHNRYVWAEHASIARGLGMTANELRRIAQGPDVRGWDPFEATLLRLADQLFRNSSVDDSTWRALAAEYDKFHLLDAVMTVGDVTSLSLLYNAIGVQPDSGTLDDFPDDVSYRVAVPPRAPRLAAPRIEPLPGPGLAIARTFQQYPRLAEPRSTGSNYVNQRSKLDPRYRELLILRTGWNCQSEYEWSQHVGSVGRAREKGLDPLKIAEGPTAAGWDAFEITLLNAADELYRDSMISDRTWNAMAARFDTTMLLNATITAANYRMVSMALNALGVQLDPGDERIPAR